MEHALTAILDISYPLANVSQCKVSKYPTVLQLEPMGFVLNVLKEHIWLVATNANKFLYYVLLIIRKVEIVPPVQLDISCKRVSVYSRLFLIRIVWDIRVLIVLNVGVDIFWLISPVKQLMQTVSISIIKRKIVNLVLMGWFLMDLHAYDRIDNDYVCFYINGSSI